MPTPSSQRSALQVACVAQGDAKTGKAFSLFFALPFPLLLCGDDLTVFRAYGLGRGTPGQLFGWRSWTHGVLATLRGHFVGKLVGDRFQMPGAFVVDTHGTVRFAHRHKDAADNPAAQILLRAAQDITGGTHSA